MGLDWISQVILFFKSMNLIKDFNSLYTLKYINASTGKYALPIKLSGVGYSRKIGMDYALS